MAPPSSHSSSSSTSSCSLSSPPPSSSSSSRACEAPPLEPKTSSSRSRWFGRMTRATKSRSPPRTSTTTLPEPAASTTPAPPKPTTTTLTINVYDLLPPSSLSSTLWTLGVPLLHSGLVVDGLEYAYGAHGDAGITGVYSTPPGVPPPGCRFRRAITVAVPSPSSSSSSSVGHCRRQSSSKRPPTPLSAADVAAAVTETSALPRFEGPAYHLLRNNCNHFTAALCERLTGRRPPAWLNRAAGLGCAAPCLVPAEWLVVPPVALPPAEDRACESGEGNVHVATETDEQEKPSQGNDTAREGRKSRPTSTASIPSDDERLIMLTTPGDRRRLERQLRLLAQSQRRREEKRMKLLESGLGVEHCAGLGDGELERAVAAPVPAVAPLPAS